jgi:hypothetical protein
LGWAADGLVIAAEPSIRKTTSLLGRIDPKVDL